MLGGDTEVGETVGLGLGKGVQCYGRSDAPWEQILFPYSICEDADDGFMPHKQRLFISLGRNAHWQRSLLPLQGAAHCPLNGGHSLGFPQWHITERTGGH